MESGAQPGSSMAFVLSPATTSQRPHVNTCLEPVSGGHGWPWVPTAAGLRSALGKPGEGRRTPLGGQEPGRLAGPSGQVPWWEG